MRRIGILLIVFGLIAFIWGGIRWIEDRDSTHFGAIRVRTEIKDRVSIPPIAGVTALVIGGLLVLMSTRGGMRLIS